MKCQRCGGLAVGVFFSGGIIATEAWEYGGWKCINCGYVTDPLIAKNKARQSQDMQKLASQSHYKRMTSTGDQVAA